MPLLAWGIPLPIGFQAKFPENLREFVLQCFTFRLPTILDGVVEMLSMQLFNHHDTNNLSIWS